MTANRPSAEESGYDRLGVVAKVHGVKGEIVIQTDLPDPRQTQLVEIVHIDDGRGMMLPYRIESSRLVIQGNRQLFFVILESVADRNTASRLMGRDVWVNSGLLDVFEDEEDDELVGYALLDSEGKTIGEVLGVLENPAHPLLRTRVNGHGEVLIPYVDVYVDDIDDDARTVTVLDIEGLLEL